MGINANKWSTVFIRTTLVCDRYNKNMIWG